jgi:hypothetical protein
MGSGGNSVIWQRVKSVEKDSPPLREGEGVNIPYFPLPPGEGNIRINGFDPPPVIFLYGRIAQAPGHPLRGLCSTPLQWEISFISGCAPLPD